MVERGPTSLPGGAPARDPGHLARWEVVGGRGQTDGPDVLVQGHVGVQLHQRDVVVVGEGVVVFVGDDSPDLPPHRPLADLTLDVQTQQRLPLVGLGIPALKKMAVRERHDSLTSRCSVFS